MSKFSKNHPKLAIAFHGAVQQMTKQNLVPNSVLGFLAFDATVGIAGLVAGAGAAIGALVLPALPIAAATFIAVTAANAVNGARKALKAVDDRPFLEKHPKLAIAFAGAVREIKRDALFRYSTTGAGVAVGAGLLVAAVGVAALPGALIAMPIVATTVSVLEGANGAHKYRKILKDVKKKNKEMFGDNAKTLKTVNDAATAEMARIAREELKNTRESLKKLIPRRHAKKMGV
jgi:hypothetical protein